MAFILSVFRAQVDNILTADNDELSQLARDREIKAAVERYSNDRPEEITEDVTGDGGKYYPITSLTSWIDGLSSILAIQYPAEDVTEDITPTMLEADDWQDDYYEGATRYIFLPNHAPASTEEFRVRYTTQYLWSASTTTTAVNQVAHGFSVNDYVYLSGSTWIKATDQRIATHRVTAVADVVNFTAAELQNDVPAADFFAVCNLAAGLCCRAISVKYSRTNDTTITVDSVDHLSRADQFRLRAKELIGDYEEHIGLATGDNGDQRDLPAGAFVDWDTAPTWPKGRGYLYH